MALLAIIHAAIAGFMLFFTAVVPQARTLRPSPATPQSAFTERRI